MAGAVLIGLQILGVKVHAIQFEWQIEFLEQPIDTTGA